MNKAINYRPEIDGLRAVAVMGVVLFHAGLGFPGGYVGVDVFFVISGFLITGLICKKLEVDSFSLLDFWAKRIRRILPAVTVVVLAVILIGLYLLDSQALSDLALSSTYQSVMSANFYFWKNTWYFGNVDHTPLLHTWTLALEEQFYVFFPILLIVIYRFFRNRVFEVLFVIALVSFGISVYFTPIYPEASFFLLPSRAWELLAGSLLAVSKGRVVSGAIAEVLSVIGLALIGYAMLVFDKNMSFPSYNAAIPVLGTVLLIYSFNSKMTLVGRVMSLKPFVFFGLISYSLYLWHWPMFAYARIVFGNFGMAIAWAMVFMSVGVSYLSYRLIENPFRWGRPKLPRKNVIWCGLAAIALLFTASISITYSGGLPGRFGVNMAGVMEDISWYGKEYQSTGTKPTLIGHHPEGEIQTKPDFVFWGDSHAMAMAKLVDRLATEQELSGEAFLQSAGIPVVGLSVVSEPENERALSLERSESILNYILDNEIQNVILVARWSVYQNGPSKSEIDEGRPWDASLVSSSIANREASLKDAASSIAHQLEFMLDQLAQAGVQVWLIKQVPEIANTHAARMFYIANRFPFIADFDQPTLTISDHNFRQQGVNQMLDTISLSGARVLDPSPSFFDQTGVIRTTPERSFYRDNDHLTANGAEYFLSEMIDSILAEIESGSP
jgi:peptidoglycan/LPS O-acetylase OafA/YrhL